MAQGVGQQVTQHLRYTVGVSLDRREIIGELSFEDENARLMPDSADPMLLGLDPAPRSSAGQVPSSAQLCWAGAQLRAASLDKVPKAFLDLIELGVCWVDCAAVAPLSGPLIPVG